LKIKKMIFKPAIMIIKRLYLLLFFGLKKIFKLWGENFEKYVVICVIPGVWGMRGRLIEALGGGEGPGRGAGACFPAPNFTYPTTSAILYSMQSNSAEQNKGAENACNPSPLGAYTWCVHDPCATPRLVPSA
jgi:hypothetical protein